MTETPDAADPAFVGPHLAALEAAAAALGTTAGAEATVRRIAGRLERAMVRQGLSEVAVVARRTVQAEPATVAAEAGRLVDLLRAIQRGALRPRSVVLVVEPDGPCAGLLVRALAGAGWGPLVVESGAEVLAVFRQQVVDAVVLSLELPDIDGREILNAFRNQPYTAELPVVVLTSSQEPWVESECLALGANRFFAKPAEPLTVVEALAPLVARPAPAAAPPSPRSAPPATAVRPAPLRVLLAEPDPLTAKLIGQRLAREGLEVHHFASGTDALAGAEALAPGAVVIDTLISGLEGLELAARLRGIAGWDDVPIIVLSAIGGEREVVRAFEAGADECLRKPFSPAELVARIDRLLKRRDR